MLRGLVLGLTAANIVLFGWTHGWLGDVAGFGPQGDREPHRMETQVHPHNLRVLPRVAAPAIANGGETGGTETDKSAVCLEAGPFTEPELTAAEAAARAALPEGSWIQMRREKPGVWLVYIGRFADRDQQKKKMAELKRLNVAFDPLDGVAVGAPNLDPGLSFGRFNRLEDAQDLLRRLENQHVQSARIVTLSPPTTLTTVRIPKADADLQALAASLRRDLKGKPFGACARS